MFCVRVCIGSRKQTEEEEAAAAAMGKTVMVEMRRCASALRVPKLDRDNV
jgi:hypothetical protein